MKNRIYKNLYSKNGWVMGKVVYNKATLLKIKSLTKVWLKKVGFIMAEKVKQKAKQEKVFDTGTYIRAVYSKLIWNDKVRVWNTKWYARIVEYWRKPWKYPPFDALVWWTARKFSLPWKTLAYKNAKPELKSKVFLVARSIKNNGIEWKDIFQKTYKENRALITKTFKSVFK